MQRQGRAALLVGFVIASLGRPSEAARDGTSELATIVARLGALAEAHPRTTRLVTVYRSAAAPVLALEIDATGRFDRRAPALLVQGGIHGNEWISSHVVLRLAELVAGGQQALPVGLIARFLPVANPEGFARAQRYARDEAGPPYDANREFPVPGRVARASRPLVQALRKYARRGNVVAVLDYHSAAECILWPWAYAKGRAPVGVAELAAIARSMARSVGFCAGQVSEVIGYKHQGTAADWYQHALGASSLLVELGAVDDPGSQRPEQILIDQERPFSAFLRHLARRHRLREPAVDPACADLELTVGQEPFGYSASGRACGATRVGRWRFRFLGGEPMREGEYVEGAEHGPWQTFHRSGRLHDEAHFTAGLPDGPWRRHGESGAVIEERAYARGQRDGPLLRWTEDGRLWQVRRCAAGRCVTRCMDRPQRRCTASDGGP